MLKLTVLYDNISHNLKLTGGWGFACLVTYDDRTVLFDTGADGATLLSNMEVLNIDPRSIEAVFLSHMHADHTGGLESFLRKNKKALVFVPVSTPRFFCRTIQSMGAKVASIQEPTRLFGRFYSSGEELSPNGANEQALVVNTPKGLVCLFGCAHPGVRQMASHIKAHWEKDILLLAGGLHLGGMPCSHIQDVAEHLVQMGVKKIAPSHCTGQDPCGQLARYFGENYIPSGLGAVITLPDV